MMKITLPLTQPLTDASNYSSGIFIRKASAVNNEKTPQCSRVQGELLVSVHVEHLRQRYADGRVVGIGLHDVCHVSPPLLDYFEAAHILTSAFAPCLLKGEEYVCFLVKIDAVVVYSAVAEQLTHFWP